MIDIEMTGRVAAIKALNAFMDETFGVRVDLGMANNLAIKLLEKQRAAKVSGQWKDVHKEDV